MLALASSRGGVGKTTPSAALAVRAAQQDERVALIDRDPAECLASWADRGGRRANPALIDIDSTAEAIVLAPAEPRFSYDFVIIDAPSAILHLIEDAINQANFVLIPCLASALDLTALDVPSSTSAASVRSPSR